MRQPDDKGSRLLTQRAVCRCTHTPTCKCAWMCGLGPPEAQLWLSISGPVVCACRGGFSCMSLRFPPVNCLHQDAAYRVCVLYMLINDNLGQAVVIQSALLLP